MNKVLLSCGLFVVLVVAAPQQTAFADNQSGTGTTVFWSELRNLCGKAFAGTVVYAPPDDTMFKDKKLVMHVRSCEENRIRIPFYVGADRSRTWVLTKDTDGLVLKHDHRHEDGTPDKITQYGGKTTSSGQPNRQMFPADQQTADILPAASSTVWWIDLDPGQHFTYNVRQLGTDKFYSIRFDLSKEVSKPDAPWGWKD